MQIPIFRDPLRDTAESIQGGLNSLAQGLMVAGQKKEKLDSDARVNAGQLRGEITREIARLMAIPEDSEDKSARLGELQRLDEQLNSVFAASRQGDAANLWSRVMAEAGIAPTLGGAAGTATNLERELASTEEVKNANTQILLNFTALLGSNPTQKGFVSQLGAQIGLIENMINTGLPLTEAGRQQLEALPGMINAVRTALGNDPEFQQYLERLNAIEAAAARKAGLEVSSMVSSMVENWMQTGIVPEGEEAAMRAYLGGMSPEAFAVETQANLTRARERRNSRDASISLANDLLSAQIDDAQHNTSVSRYRAGREQMLDGVTDAVKAREVIQGAVLTGDMQMLALISRELEDPDSARGAYWRAAGLTAAGLREKMDEAAMSADYQLVVKETALLNARAGLETARRVGFTNAVTDRLAIMENAGRGLAPNEVEGWFDSLSPSEQQILMGPGGSRESAIRGIKDFSRLNQLAVAQPLRADAMSRATMLLNLPIPGAQNGVLTSEAIGIMNQRAGDIYDILLPEFGHEFASQFQLGAAELAGRGAKAWEWELMAKEWSAKLLQAQTYDAYASAAARGRTGAEKPFDWKPYRDGVSDAIDSLTDTMRSVVRLQEQGGCIDYMDTSGPIPIRVLAAPKDVGVCADYAERLAQMTTYQSSLAGEMTILSELEMRGIYNIWPEFRPGATATNDPAATGGPVRDPSQWSPVAPPPGTVYPPPGSTAPPPPSGSAAPPPPSGSAAPPPAAAQGGAAAPAGSLQSETDAARAASREQWEARRGTQAGATTPPPPAAPQPPATTRDPSQWTPAPGPVLGPSPTPPPPGASGVTRDPSQWTPAPGPTAGPAPAPVRPAPNQSGIAPHISYSSSIAGMGRDNWWWEDPAYDGYNFTVTVREPNGRERRVLWSTVVQLRGEQFEIVGVPPEPTVALINPRTGQIQQVPMRQAERLGWEAAPTGGGR